MRSRTLLLLTLVCVVGVALWFFQPWSGERKRFFVNESIAASSEELHRAPEAAGFRVDVAVEGLDLPWDLAFLSPDEILVTEKAGRMLRIDLRTGQRQAVSGMPEVTVHGQGGLHAVLLHPKFKDNQLIYLSYADRSPDGGYTTHFSRARLQGNALSDLRLLLRAKAATGRSQHFGGAMAFDNDGYLFLSVGDRGERDDAQNLERHNGKILRLTDDGGVPESNPFVLKHNALPEIWSYGHRNPQGMDFDRANGRLWAVEHGPRGGDEVNLIEPGVNYGWPVITYGKEYVGGRIGEGTARQGMAQPVHHYVPSIATAGMAYYQSTLFPQWRDSVLVTALRGHLNRVQLDGARFAAEQRYLAGRGLRLRAVRISPSGEPWVVADDGVILRLRPEVALPPIRASRFFMLRREDRDLPLIPRPFSILPSVR